MLCLMRPNVLPPVCDGGCRRTCRLENFLSPEFKRYLPAFAEEYGVEYGLVTYKWPSWLRGQTEKQRIIWGYKMQVAL